MVKKMLILAMFLFIVSLSYSQGLSIKKAISKVIQEISEHFVVDIPEGSRVVICYNATIKDNVITVDDTKYIVCNSTVPEMELNIHIHGKSEK